MSLIPSPPYPTLEEPPELKAESKAPTAAPNRGDFSAKIKQKAQELGFELVGFSPAKPPPHGESFAQWLRDGMAGELEYMKRSEGLRRRPEELLPWAVSVVSVGMNYLKPLARPGPSATPQGWISRYAWGEDYHQLMKDRLETLLGYIKTLHGGEVQGRVFVDSGPVLERDFAGSAGLGWIGKNTHLISPKKGSWFFLGELFLNLPLSYDRAMRDRCGECELCIKACPTKAFVGPYVLDARRCISYLTIELKGWIPRYLRPLVGNHIFGCDICQEVCPYNVKAISTREPAFDPRPGLYAPELIPLLSLHAEEFRQRFKNSPILRAKRRGFLRNVAVALGNLKSVEAVAALARALSDEEALVRGHAAWALGEIGTVEATQALEARFSVETEPAVLSEIEQALASAQNKAAAGSSR
jgi:epoxyqueuosine reductase